MKPPYIILLKPAADGQMLVDPARGSDGLLTSPFTNLSRLFLPILSGCKR